MKKTKTERSDESNLATFVRGFLCGALITFVCLQSTATDGPKDLNVKKKKLSHWDMVRGFHLLFDRMYSGEPEDQYGLMKETDQNGNTVYFKFTDEDPDEKAVYVSLQPELLIAESYAGSSEYVKFTYQDDNPYRLIIFYYWTLYDLQKPIRSAYVGDRTLYPHMRQETRKIFNILETIAVNELKEVNSNGVIS